MRSAVVPPRLDSEDEEMVWPRPSFSDFRADLWRPSLAETTTACPFPFCLEPTANRTASKADQSVSPPAGPAGCPASRAVRARPLTARIGTVSGVNSDAESALTLPVEDVFRIPGRSVVATGVLQGNGAVRRGNVAVAGSVRVEVLAVASGANNKTVSHAAAGSRVGLHLGPWDPAEVQRRTVLTLVPPLPGARDADRYVIPATSRTLVLCSGHAERSATCYAVLDCDGAHIRLLRGEEDPLLDGPASEITVSVRNSRMLQLTHAGRTVDIRGASPAWYPKLDADSLVTALNPATALPTRAWKDLPFWTHLIAVPAMKPMRWMMAWQPVLSAILATAGTHQAP